MRCVVVGCGRRLVGGAVVEGRRSELKGKRSCIYRPPEVNLQEGKKLVAPLAFPPSKGELSTSADITSF
jgi:hypothetical protein